MEQEQEDEKELEIEQEKELDHPHSFGEVTGKHPDRFWCLPHSAPGSTTAALVDF